MNREILFRGKRIDNGEWVEGYLLRTKFYLDDSEHSLIFTDVVEFPRSEFSGANEVIPETVGQYTGLRDKNGKRIFEGDIIRCGGKVVGVVNYHDCCFCVRFIMKDHANRSNPAMDIIENEYPNDIEVIGNIHDNPELLEVEG